MKCDHTGKEPRGSITMDGPKTVTAVGTTSYSQLYMIAGAGVVTVLIAVLLVRRRGQAASAYETQIEGPHEKSLPSSQICPNCGRQNRLQYYYCGACGRPLRDGTKIY